MEIGPFMFGKDSSSVSLYGQRLLKPYWHKSYYNRLAAIDTVGGDTGVKPQHWLRHLPTVAPSPPSFRFFYSNKNNLVQLEDTTIKIECSMQRMDDSRASQIRFHLSREESRLTRRVRWDGQDKTMQKSFKTKCKSACFKNILDLEKPVDFCR